MVHNKFIIIVNYILFVIIQLDLGNHNSVALYKIQSLSKLMLFFNKNYYFIGLYLKKLIHNKLYNFLEVFMYGIL